MPLVASVRLRYASQDYWFDPAGLDIKAGDHVLVETSKGNEIGLCTHDVVDVDEAEVTKPLKPVIRIATFGGRVLVRRVPCDLLLHLGRARRFSRARARFGSRVPHAHRHAPDRPT